MHWLNINVSSSILQMPCKVLYFTLTISFLNADRKQKTDQINIDIKLISIDNDWASCAFNWCNQKQKAHGQSSINWLSGIDQISVKN